MFDSLDFSFCYVCGEMVDDSCERCPNCRAKFRRTRENLFSILDLYADDEDDKKNNNDFLPKEILKTQKMSLNL